LFIVDIYDHRFWLPFSKRDIACVQKYLSDNIRVCFCGNAICPGDFAVKNSRDEIFCDRPDCCDPGQMDLNKLESGYWDGKQFVPSKA
jgi:hypothetical protein